MPLETKEIAITETPPAGRGTEPPSPTSPSRINQLTSACVAWVLKNLRAREKQQ